MGVSPSCVAAVVDASGGKFDDNEAAELIRYMEALKASEAAAGNLDGLDARVRTLAAQEADRARIAAAQARRHAALAAVAYERRLAQTRELVAQGRRHDQALLAVFEGDGQRGLANGRASVQATKGAYLSRYLTPLHRLLQGNDRIRKLVEAGDTPFADRVTREMGELREGGKPGITRDADALALARTYAQIAEQSRLDRNRHGGSIGRLDGWRPQSHDSALVAKAGKDTWIAAILPRLDAERTFGANLNEAQQRRVLSDMFDHIAAGLRLGREAADPLKRVGPANLANKLGAARELHFRDAEAWLQYRQQFGQHHIHGAMVSHLQRASRDAALLEILGPNPEAMLGTLRRQLAADAMADAKRPYADREAARNVLNARRGPIDDAMAEASGLTSQPVNSRWSDYMAAFRNQQRAAKLAGALLSQVTDLAVRAARLTLQGDPILAAYGKSIGIAVAPNASPEVRALLASVAAGADGMRSSAWADMMPEDSRPGFWSRTTDRIMRIQGQQWWGDRLRGGTAYMLSEHMGRQAGRSWSGLDPLFQRRLENYGVTRAMWEAIRPHARTLDGRRFITPDMAQDIPQAELATLAKPALETLQKGLAEKITRRAAANAQEAGWVTRRVARFDAQLAQAQARMEAASKRTKAAGAREVAGLRQQIDDLRVALSDLAEFQVAVAEGRDWTPAAEPPAPVDAAIGAPVILANLPPAAFTQAQAAFRSTMAGWDLDRLYAKAQANQDGLTADLATTASRIDGAAARTAPLKARETAADKIMRKGYADASQLTDVVRGGFDVATPEAADLVIRDLADRYPLIDEGWASTEGGYFDRKALIRLPDGTVAEIQFWPPGMFDAKETKGGHRLYEEARKPGATPERKAELEAQMRALYGETLTNAGTAWRARYDAAEASAGRGGTDGNISRKTEAETGRPLSRTSAHSTSTQPPPGETTASALPGDRMAAGRPSQLQNRTSDTPGSPSFTPRSERYLHSSTPAESAALRMEGELRHRLDRVRRAMGRVGQQAVRQDIRRLEDFDAEWMEKSAELEAFVARVDQRTKVRNAATLADNAQWDSRVEAVLSDTRRDVEMAFRRYYADEMLSSTLEPDAQSRRFLLRGTQPGTATGEALRLIGLFKAFPVAYAQRVLAAAIHGFRDGERGRQAAHIGGLLAASTLLGYVAMTAKDAVRGYAPRDPTHYKTWLAAMAQGGGIGIYGDFLFGQGSRFGNSPLETVAGPALGGAANLIGIWQRAKDGDAKAGDALGVVLRETPYVNLWWARPMLDAVALNWLREAVSPGTLKRQAKQRLDDYGQERWAPETVWR